jgi:hypothetical protein
MQTHDASLDAEDATIRNMRGDLQQYELLWLRPAKSVFHMPVFASEV